jgi:hypothetical protein
VVAALALTGCTLHPGAAAVVNSTTISQNHVEDLVLAACSFQKAARLKSGGASPSTSTASFRTFFTQNLITFELSGAAADRLHLTVTPAAIAKITTSETVPAGVDPTDRQLLVEFFTDSARSELQAAVIGAHQKNPSVTTADNVTKADLTAGNAYLKSYAAKQHILVNPAIGTWVNGKIQPGDGSLSAPVSAAARNWLSLRAAGATSASTVTGLPPSQICG